MRYAKGLTNDWKKVGEHTFRNVKITDGKHAKRECPAKLNSISDMAFESRDRRKKSLSAKKRGA